MNAVEAFGLGAGETDALLGDDAEAGLLEHGVDRTGEITLRGVRFNDGEGALDGHEVFLKGGSGDAIEPVNRARTAPIALGTGLANWAVWFIGRQGWA